MSFLKELFKTKSVKKGLIFIIEDNVAYAKTISEYLSANFFEVKEVKNFTVGETCLLEIDKNPDIIIIDYFLDSKYSDAETGLEIVKQIRKKKPKIPIILLSSQQEVQVIKDAITKYNCRYIKKDKDFLTKVAEIIKEIYKH